ncbi:hypothetical protein [Yinghuangia seranimata]|uniref:hypothetical protein n=1 Tax=Yinghuangia seranimata TaxID=408067 RepID=UPI00248C0A18|nr:hypothetical protein [Yinghuangia seranimata]MDI2126549.1 hypothetical protein [Yinghuangia seranimata]
MDPAVPPTYSGVPAQGGSPDGVPSGPPSGTAPEQTSQAAPEAAAAPTEGRFRSRFRIRKPDIDKAMDGRGLLSAILLFPLLMAVVWVGQIIELIVYAAIALFYIAASPFLLVVYLWRTFGPARTPEEIERRARYRSGGKTFLGCLGIVVLVCAVLFAILAWYVTWGPGAESDY